MPRRRLEVALGALSAAAVICTLGLLASGFWPMPASVHAVLATLSGIAAPLAAVIATETAWLAALADATFQREPAAALALTGVLVVPVLAATAGLARWLGRRPPHAPGLAPSEPALRRANQAWVVQADGSGEAVAVGELARIGRGDDCCIALADRDAAETHALIQRSGDCEFFLIDVSAIDGASPIVNGHAVSWSPLADGDRIELCGACFVFRQSAFGDLPGQESRTAGRRSRRLAGRMGLRTKQEGERDGRQAG